jgi:hypothetical protein
MDDYNGAWAKLLQGGNVTFVRAKLVGREDLSMSMEEKKMKIQEKIQSLWYPRQSCRDIKSWACTEFMVG